jgi:hypothetical protein
LVYICLEDFNDQYKFLEKKKKNCIDLDDDDTNNKITKESCYMGEEKYNKNKNIIFYFKNNKYIYLENIEKFRSVEMNLNIKNSEIHDFYCNGISEIKEYNYLLNKFGENILKMKSKSYLNIIIKKLFNPIYLYNIFALIVWIFEEYYYFAFVVFTFSFFSLLITSYQKYTNYRNICNYSELLDVFKIEKVFIKIFFLLLLLETIIFIINPINPFNFNRILNLKKI